MHTWAIVFPQIGLQQSPLERIGYEGLQGIVIRSRLPYINYDTVLLEMQFLDN
jgi:hypothetical protein